MMRKTEAYNVFGGKPEQLAAALGASYNTIIRWPDELPTDKSDRPGRAIFG
jgi:hypothetical protein